MLKFVKRAVAGIFFLAVSGATYAQAWPAAPIRIIVPFPAGGNLDQLARMLAPHLQHSLGQPVIVENRSGASGSIGTAVVAKAAPDGYNIALVFDTHSVNPSLIPSLPFDTVKDLVPIMLIATSPMVITTNPTSPYKSFSDLVSASKAKPGSVAYGTIGAGSLAQLAMSYFGNQLKLEFTHVPYKGGAPLVTDSIAGHVPVTIASVALLSPAIKAGKLRPLAVTSAQRFAQLPDVPTMAEQGVANFGAEAWWGILAPAGTPDPVVARLNAEFAKALKIPAMQERLVDQGASIRASSPEEFGAFIANEMARWSKVVRDNKITAGG